MAMNTFVPIFLPEAMTLADLTGIYADLRDARQYAAILETEMHTRAYPELPITDAFTTAMLIKYARAFASGVRSPLKIDDIPSITPHLKEAHDHFYTLRQMHVAHSVSSFEHNQPHARYRDDKVMTEGIASIGCNHERVIGFGIKGLKDMQELTALLLEHVSKMIKEEEAKLLVIVRGLPINEVLANDVHSSLHRSNNPKDKQVRIKK